MLRIGAYLRRERDVLRGCPIGGLTQDPEVVADPQLRQPIEETLSWLQIRLAEVLAEGQRSGELSESFSPSRTASMLCAVLQGGYVLARGENSVQPFTEAIEGALSLLDTLISNPVRPPEDRRGDDRDRRSLSSLEVTLIGGPTALLGYGGVRFITDPTFDPPGAYEPRPGVKLTKTTGPAFRPEAVGEVDVVLLSHDHHKDNLDDAGRAFLARVSQVLTTVSGAERLGPAGNGAPQLDECGSRLDLVAGRCSVTGVPAQHGPDGSEHLVGEVTGFLLTAEDLPSVYVSGDNASLDVVQQIVDRVGTVDIAVLFAGGAQMPYLGDAYLTLPSAGAVRAAQLLEARVVVPLHLDSWGHFSEGRSSLHDAFADAGLLERLVVPPAGETISVPNVHLGRC